MKKLITILLISSSGALLAADAPATKPAVKTPDQNVPSNCQMSIDPKARAQDYLQAFDVLRKDKTPNKIVFELTDGTSLTNVIDMTLMGNGNLILFRINTPQGIKTQVVGVEQIKSLSHQ
jgi:hypothetical protein